MREKIIAALVGVTLFATSAGAETYICNVKPIGRDTGWISNTLAIDVNAATSDVLVNDAIILHFNKGPLKGRISAKSDKRLTVRWEVKSAKDDRNQSIARFMYRATIYKLTNKLTITANPGGYSNSIRGTGKCKIRS